MGCRSSGSWTRRAWTWPPASPTSCAPCARAGVGLRWAPARTRRRRRHTPVYGVRVLRARSGDQSREILRLAVPAFLALIAEPLFLLADSAIIGHLGTAELAGLGVASAALVTAAGVFVFLAYGTTSVVARHLGAGDERSAVSAGIDGLWLALGLGAGTAAVVAVWAGPISAILGASPAVLEQATTYLRISALGIPAMLAVLAVTGVLR